VFLFRIGTGLNKPTVNKYTLSATVFRHSAVVVITHVIEGTSYIIVCTFAMHNLEVQPKAGYGLIHAQLFLYTSICRYCKQTLYMSGFYAMFSKLFLFLFFVCWFAVSACKQVIAVDVFIVSYFFPRRYWGRIYIVLRPLILQ
jgi:hypothetical protein